MRIDQVVKPNSKVMTKLAQDAIDKLEIKVKELRTKAKENKDE